MPARAITLEQRDDVFIGHFQAMASPCEILIETLNEPLAQRLTRLAAEETWRIEDKFSRYQPNNIIDQINHAQGKAIELDEESAKLMDFATTCFEISDGLFDITSGILRKVWTFDGSDRIPKQSDIDPLLALIGWDKVKWAHPHLTLLPGMEIDLGGIGKEYAVDRVQALLTDATECPVLVNFGGDLHANKSKSGNRPWVTGIDNPSPEKVGTRSTIELHHGALATSGDAFRFLQRKGKRYSHVLNPKTGWPVKHAARSVTVAAAHCIDAGILSTMALLQGENAEQFLQAQEVKHWVIR